MSIFLVLCAVASVALLVPHVVSLFSDLNESRRCLNGHHVAPRAKFCEECGAPLVPSTR